MDALHLQAVAQLFDEDGAPKVPAEKLGEILELLCRPLFSRQPSWDEEPVCDKRGETVLDLLCRSWFRLPRDLDLSKAAAVAVWHGDENLALCLVRRSKGAVAVLEHVLMAAVKTGARDVVTTLLQQYPQAVSSKMWFAALHRAARYHDTDDMLRLLLLNHKGPGRLSATRLCVLLQIGANPGLVLRRARRAVVSSALKRCPRLLAIGPKVLDALLLDGRGKMSGELANTLLDTCAERGYLLPALIDTYHANSVDALYLAAVHNHRDLVKFLLQHNHLLSRIDEAVLEAARRPATHAAMTTLLLESPLVNPNYPGLLAALVHDTANLQRCALHSQFNSTVVGVSAEVWSAAVQAVSDDDARQRLGHVQPVANHQEWKAKVLEAITRPRETYDHLLAVGLLETMSEYEIDHEILHALARTNLAERIYNVGQLPRIAQAAAWQNEILDECARSNASLDSTAAALKLKHNTFVGYDEMRPLVLALRHNCHSAVMAILAVIHSNLAAYASAALWEPVYRVACWAIVNPPPPVEPDRTDEFGAVKMFLRAHFQSLQLCRLASHAVLLSRSERRSELMQWMKESRIFVFEEKLMLEALRLQQLDVFFDMCRCMSRKCGFYKNVLHEALAHQNASYLFAFVTHAQRDFCEELIRGFQNQESHPHLEELCRRAGDYYRPELLAFLLRQPKLRPILREHCRNLQTGVQNLLATAMLTDRGDLVSDMLAMIDTSASVAEELVAAMLSVPIESPHRNAVARVMPQLVPAMLAAVGKDDNEEEEEEGEEGEEVVEEEEEEEENEGGSASGTTSAPTEANLRTAMQELLLTPL